MEWTFSYYRNGIRILEILHTVNNKSKELGKKRKHTKKPLQLLFCQSISISFITFTALCPNSMRCNFHQRFFHNPKLIIRENLFSMFSLSFYYTTNYTSQWSNNFLSILLSTNIHHCVVFSVFPQVSTSLWFRYEEKNSISIKIFCDVLPPKNS